MKIRRGARDRHGVVTRGGDDGTHTRRAGVGAGSSGSLGIWGRLVGAGRGGTSTIVRGLFLVLFMINHGESHGLHDH